MKFGPVVQQEMAFKDGYLEPWWSSYSLIYAVLKEGIIIGGTLMLSYMKFGPVVQDVLFADISYLELWQPLCQWTGTICAILEEGITRNNPVKLF